MEKPKTIQTKIDIKQTTQTVCEKCGGEAFQEAFMLRKVSAIVSPNGQVGFLPVQIFGCMACGHVNPEFIPQEVKDRLAI